MKWCYDSNARECPWGFNLTRCVECETLHIVARTQIDTAALYNALDAARMELNLSWRALAKEVGVSPSLFSRLGNGMKPDADGFATIVSWLRVPADRFFVTGEGGIDSTEQPELMTELAPLLRARKDLSELDVKYLEQVILATIERTKAQG